MKAIVVSDLHIGSRYFLHENFAQFLKNIPEDAEFILDRLGAGKSRQRVYP